jgi:hypothetical protein
VIADNKLALNAGWDEQLLAIELDDLRDMRFDLSLLGFEAKELNDLIGTPNFGPGSIDEQGRLDQKAPVTCPKCKHVFTP